MAGGAADESGEVCVEIWQVVPQMRVEGHVARGGWASLR